MYVYARLFKALLAAWRAPKLGILETSVLRFRVWPNDLDFNFHLNNGRYLTLMDIGRDLLPKSEPPRSRVLSSF